MKVGQAWRKDFKPNTKELEQIGEALQKVFADNPDPEVWQMIVDSQRVYFYGLQQLVVASMPDKSKWNEELESLYSQQYAVFQGLKSIRDKLNA